MPDVKAPRAPLSIHERLMRSNPKYRARQLKRDAARKQGKTLAPGVRS